MKGTTLALCLSLALPCASLAAAETVDCKPRNALLGGPAGSMTASVSEA